MQEKTPIVESVFFLAIQLTLLGEMSSMIVKIDALAGSQLCYICCSLYTYSAVYAIVPTESPKNVGTSRILLVNEGFASTMAKNWVGGQRSPPGIARFHRLYIIQNQRKSGTLRGRSTKQFVLEHRLWHFSKKQQNYNLLFFSQEEQSFS